MSIPQPSAGGPWVAWLLLGVLLIVIELVHSQWILIWFSSGAFAAAAFAAFYPSATVLQLGLFLLVSLALIVVARPIAAFLIFNKHGRLVTNIAAIVGRVETCIEKIDGDGLGAIRVYGSAWHARTARPDVRIRPGEKVRIVEIRGLELIVEPLEEAERADAAEAIEEER